MYLAEQCVYYNGFVWRMSGKTVCAGQVNQVGMCTVAKGKRADFVFYRYAWVVTDALGKTGERIKERCLARIGVANERKSGQGVARGGK